MTTRRDFIRKTSLALVGGVVVGDEVVEMFERLTHKKVWAGWSGPPKWAADKWGGSYTDLPLRFSAPYVKSQQGRTTILYDRLASAGLVERR